MSNLHIRLLMVFAVLTLVGIVSLQVYWLRQASYQEERVFSYNIQSALHNVVESLCELTDKDLPASNPIEQVSGNYFVVRTNDYIDLELLDFLISEEIRKRSVTDYFEYGVYDCENDQMVFQENVSFINQSKASVLPDLQNQNYYFGVYFPGRSRWLTGGFDLWTFTFVLTIVVIVFFGYTLFVVLRQKRLSEVQKDFVNNIIHELKTPLTTLSIATQGLRNEHSDKKLYSGILDKEVDKLKDQVDRILETASMEQLHVETKPLKLKPLLTDVLKEYESIHPSCNFQLNNLDEAEVKAHASYLEMIIKNLLDNAVKNGAKQAAIKVSSNRGNVVIDVRDDGRGIPSKYQKKVFKKFFRVPERGNQHNRKGFGLGLYIVKTLMKKMKGSVILSSTEGKGSSFQLLLRHV